MMSPEDLKLLMDWFEENKDHKLNFLEKEVYICLEILFH